MHEHPLFHQKKAMRIGASIIIGTFVVTLATIGKPVGVSAVDLVANVSANVVTPITLAENTALSFGNIAITSGSDDTTPASISLDADSGTVTDPPAQPNGANIVSLTGATVGEFTVFAGVAEAIPMTITVSSTATLSLAGQDDLDVSAITVGKLVEGLGLTGDCSAGCNMTSSATGNIRFPVGATLTMSRGDGNFGDGSYSGSFTVTAIYQ
ncbi:MAG: DUF4402 domain-containing protein [Proteobacteria bacterium]|nr:DUF4402 domain-containing protein [Pseudomonadota bacterium]